MEEAQHNERCRASLHFIELSSFYIYPHWSYNESTSLLNFPTVCLPFLVGHAMVADESAPTGAGGGIVGGRIANKVAPTVVGC